MNKVEKIKDAFKKVKIEFLQKYVQAEFLKRISHAVNSFYGILSGKTIFTLLIIFLFNPFPQVLQAKNSLSKKGLPLIRQDNSDNEGNSSPTARISSRAVRMINNWHDNPYPDLTDGDGFCVPHAGYILSSFFTGRNVNEANAAIYTKIALSDFSSDIHQDMDEIDCYWALSSLVRVVLDPQLAVNLIEGPGGTKEILVNKMLDLIFQRSDIAMINSEGVWVYWGSENHDLMHKANLYMATEILCREGRGNLVIADGHTIATHRTAWISFFKKYLHGRAREGIFAEVASPIYDKYSLVNIYNIRDFSIDPVLKNLANSFLHLYWADVAQEFIPGLGIRGGASTRTYKDKYLVYGIFQGSRVLAYAYSWHDNFDENLSIHPVFLGMLMSDYEPPDIIRNIAVDTTKPPYQYISRRYGRGHNIEPDKTLFLFDSYIRRYSFITPDYVLGTMRFHPEVDYTGISAQNRTMGVIFASDIDARIMVIGKGDHGAISDELEGKITGYNEMTGAANNNCMIIARDINANRSVGSRIYISYAGGLWGNRIEEEGWFFTYSENGYVAIKITEGSYVKQSVPSGKVLELTKMWAPVLIQLGQAENFASFSDFRARVLAQNYNYINGKLDYTSICGHRWEFWKQGGVYGNPIQAILHLSGGGSLSPSLNPAKTYSSPYILGYHGFPPEGREWMDQKVLISYEGDELVLDFNDRVVIEVPMELPEGWSMVSLPVRPEIATVSTLFPEAVVVYKYRKGQGYVRVQEEDDLEVGMGYWILLDKPRSYMIRGTVIPEYTIQVADDWYMIGGCTVPAQKMVTDGRIDVIYKYTQGVGYTWVPGSEPLQPGKGYWIKFSNTSEGAEFTASTLVSK